MLEKQLEYLKKIYFNYYLLIFDERRIKQSINLFNILINLILQWVSIDTTQMNRGNSKNYKPSELLNHIPEDYLTMIYEFHVFYLKHFDQYINSLNGDQVNI